MTTPDDDTLAASLAGITNPVGRAPARRCKTGTILDTVSPANRAAILNHLHGNTTSDGRLAKILLAGGLDVSASSLSYHRNRMCRCTVFGDDEVTA